MNNPLILGCPSCGTLPRPVGEGGAIFLMRIPHVERGDVVVCRHCATVFVILERHLTEGELDT